MLESLKISSKAEKGILLSFEIFSPILLNSSTNCCSLYFFKYDEGNNLRQKLLKFQQFLQSYKELDL
ncbi:hypothetical protein AP75_12820 [Kaistella haifensis DSM 19056]|uniref:Uncharacterized protein n=1 Tax=Kaistella haifensis DSM 19056 TaxID=1450526 RepID=A0A246B7N4_9FLAO|nr:hypothetical protein AP75_12820 [Kaistella haifensis DSM 19056]